MLRKIYTDCFTIQGAFFYRGNAQKPTTIRKKGKQQQKKRKTIQKVKEIVQGLNANVKAIHNFQMSLSLFKHEKSLE